MTDDPLALARHRTEAEARAAVIACALQMNALGINHGKAGNVSCRWDRSAASGYLITPAALPFHRLEAADIVWMALEADDGDAPDEARGQPSSEWRFHRDLYRARGQVQALVHTHSLHAAALSCLPAIQRSGLPPFHYMIATLGGSDVRCAAYHSFGTQALSDAVIAAMQGRHACLMAHHGLLAAGGHLAQALSRALELERLSQMYALGLSLGGPALLDEAQMQDVMARFARRG